MMKIVMKKRTSDGNQITELPFATSLGENLLKNKCKVNLNRSQLKQMVKALNRFKKQCSLPLVEVISEDTEVIVRW